MRRLTCIAFLLPLIWVAAASASVRACAYRDLPGAAPHVAAVRTNLAPAVVRGAGVCAVVEEAVAAVQRQGYRLDGTSVLVTAHGRWLMRHHLVYPPGWPRRSRGATDPHMEVTLVKLFPRSAGNAGVRSAGGLRLSSYWIRLDEWT
jgi:hypothetical protein